MGLERIQWMWLHPLSSMSVDTLRWKGLGSSGLNIPVPESCEIMTRVCLSVFQPTTTWNLSVRLSSKNCVSVVLDIPREDLSSAQDLRRKRKKSRHWSSHHSKVLPRTETLLCFHHAGFIYPPDSFFRPGSSKYPMKKSTIKVNMPSMQNKYKYIEQMCRMW